MSQQYMHIRDNFNLPGIVTSIEEVERLKNDLYAPGYGDRDVTFFERSHNHLYLRGAVTYWKKKLTQFPQNIQQQIWDATENATTSNVSNNGKQIFHKDDQSVSSKFELDMASLEREDPVQERLLEHVSQ